jgi:flagellar basal-body rod protein FlgB
MLDLTGNTSLPHLEAGMRFAWRRHGILVNNVANVSTPGFRASDLPVEQFQKALARATREPGGSATVLTSDGPRRLRRAAPSLSFHDFRPALNRGAVAPNGNDVSPELEAAKLAKNAGWFAALAELSTRQFDLLEKAIRERM